MGFTPVYSNGNTTAPRSSRSRKSSTSRARFDRIVLIADMDGKVYARCYTGATYTDAVIPYGCLANLVGDGAKMLRHLYQKNAR